MFVIEVFEVVAAAAAATVNASRYFLNHCG